jgi:hypothetical protein
MRDTPISTVIRDYATVVAIIIGGGWALWRWRFDEWLRRHRDFPALDGEIRTVEAKLNDRDIFVMVNALWRNRAKLPVKLDTAKTFVKVYKLGHTLPTGPFDPQTVEPFCTARPLSGASNYTLEPGTDSIMQQCLVLPANEIVLIHWAVCIAASQPAYPYLKSEMWCVRYHIRSAALTAPSEAANPPLAAPEI